ncbi:flavin reductase [Bradyrhizobium sp. I71]|nr:flavin reductase [Bradyrhizobium sp. I71]
MSAIRQSNATEQSASTGAPVASVAAVNIVTTDGVAGRAGLTASAICSVTDDPPTLLVCINRGSFAYASVMRNKVVCVNVLPARHEPLSRLFGGKAPAEERFAAAAWSPRQAIASR